MNLKNRSITPKSSNAITGLAVNSTTVYHGPSSSIYATVGSIGPNETVNILATSMGWYHIEYNVTNTTLRKTGYVPQSTLTNITGGIPTEEDFYGGYCYASTELDVRTCDVFANTSTVGTLFAKEGCTFLFSYTVNGSNVAFIEYATSSGTKRGYVYADYLVFPCETIVCIANETISVYGGPDFSTSAQLGTIYANELMGLVAKKDNVIYVEYNTPKGRKRGYVDWTKVNPRDYAEGTVFNNFYTTPPNSSCHIKDEGTAVPVYGGPSTSYAQLGSVNFENIICFWTNTSSFPLTCIEYVVTTTGKIKRGYIDPLKVYTGNLPLQDNDLEDLTVQYANFERHVYGQTQLNKDMVYYKTGNGSNHIFLTFALHGWEDGTTADGKYVPGDGNSLIKIAKRFMHNFGNLPTSRIQEIQNKWTIFVFPGINLDGIANGYNNNTFGRCLYSGLDPNRNWPGNFSQNTSSPRYKTGFKYLGNNADNSDAKELVNLKNIITANAGTSQNVLIDVHGWYNQTIGNVSIGEYYWDSFGIPKSRHSYSYGDGYLIAWAKNPIDEAITSQNQPGIGASTCLLELPPTTDYSDTNMNNYGDKFFTSTINLLHNTGDTVGYPDNTDGSEFEKLFSQIEQVYNLANDYKPNATVAEKNTLALQFLRHEEYGSGSYEFLYGDSDNDFLTFIAENKNIPDPNYIKPANIIVPDAAITDGVNGAKGVRIAHLAATLNGYLYNLFSDTSKETDANSLGGWAGDLIQMANAFEKKFINLTYQEAANIIATNDKSILETYTQFKKLEDTGYCYEDWTQDIDAVCMADDLSETPLHQVFRDYYTNPNRYNNRHHTFIEKIISNGSHEISDVYAHALHYLDGEGLAAAGFNIAIGLYFGSNKSEIAMGFAHRLLEFYYLEEPDNPGIPNLMYAAHCQNLGWQEEKRNGEMAGLYGQGLRIEAVIINADINIQYRVHMAGIGWGEWVPNGCQAGTTGESRAIEAIEIISSSNTMKGQGYVENIGYQSEVTGTHITIGTTGQGLRLEGFRLEFLAS